MSPEEVLFFVFFGSFLGLLWIAIEAIDSARLSSFSLRPHLAYARYVFRHKWFVFQECRKLRLPLRIALFHDWDKFLPDEWFPYVHTFYDRGGKHQYIETTEFTYAWNLHQKRNKHHWQFWLITFDRGEMEALDMPDVYRREMLADWRGAGKALGKPDIKAWYLANQYHMILHPLTRVWIEQQLGVDHD